MSAYPKLNAIVLDFIMQIEIKLEWIEMCAFLKYTLWSTNIIQFKRYLCYGIELV